MTGQMPEHSVFAELAAGYAVHALEPEDERRFLRHAEDCGRCQQLLADFGQVAAALAETAPLAEPSRGLGDRIVAAALADASQRQPTVPQPSTGVPARRAPARHEKWRPGADHDGAGTVPLRRRAARQWHKLAAAAAVLLAVGAGTWAGLAATGGAHSTGAVCARPRACAEVVLTASASHRPAAKVFVHDGVAWMQPTAMAPNPANEIYVLWQITGAHTPLPVGSFDIRPGRRRLIRIGGLAATYSRTWAFAVSLEHGRTIPASPSHPVALGQV